MSKKVGVLSLQGAYQKHAECLKKLDSNIQISLVRSPEDLDHIERLIIPGGESTTVTKLLAKTGIDKAIITAGQQGMPIWGTCMGMILLAKEICPNKNTMPLGMLDVNIQRNAFGPQIQSFEAPVHFSPLEREVLGVFIRAPIVTHVSDSVEILATYKNNIVAVRQSNIVGTAFHPELTDDLSVHHWFLSL
jgi:5'-phosphate synthase pdxT subunit